MQRYKRVVFGLSAFLAGPGGGLFATAHEFVALDVLHWRDQRPGHEVGPARAFADPGTTILVDGQALNDTLTP